MEDKQEVRLTLSTKTVAKLLVALAQAGAYYEVRKLPTIAAQFQTATDELIGAFGQTLADEIAMGS